MIIAWPTNAKGAKDVVTIQLQCSGGEFIANKLARCPHDVAKFYY